MVITTTVSPLNAFSKIERFSKLQVCDVGVNKPFKDYVKQEYEQFMVTQEGRKAKRLDVAKWISKAWNSISADSIQHTWSSIGIKAT